MEKKTSAQQIVNDHIMLAYYKMLKTDDPMETFWIFAKRDLLGETTLQTIVHESDEVARINKVIADVLKRRLQKRGFLNL